ncbi:hypothetical protein L6452_44527 [Arctium lappa]|uniref:Uncharacterized protein n=1 Tax=Arctium lappa TaxID=4217 RepID=A0ACB8XGR0_ARCLA|nr:hypothetical protein L6452_44527 [Arctium lappa]
MFLKHMTLNSRYHHISINLHHLRFKHFISIFWFNRDRKPRVLRITSFFRDLKVKRVVTVICQQWGSLQESGSKLCFLVKSHRNLISLKMPL